MCTTAAPAFAASSAEFAISAGVTGTAGFFDGVSNEPVSAQVMTVFRDMFSPIPARILAIPLRYVFSVLAESPVDHDGLAGDVAVHGKEQHRLGDVHRLRDLPQERAL